MFDAAASSAAPTIDDPNSCVDVATRELIAETVKYGAKLPPNWTTGVAARAKRTGAQRKTEAENLVRVHAAGIPVALGTDAGNPLTLHGPAIYAEAEAMQAAGMKAADVLVAATRNAALAMGREKDLGTLEPGKLADLVVLGGDPTADVANLRRLEYVMRGGELRAQAELRALPKK
jgi:imidazolonepropionase-like amidohydrolase